MVSYGLRTPPCSYAANYQRATPPRRATCPRRRGRCPKRSGAPGAMATFRTSQKIVAAIPEVARKMRSDIYLPTYLPTYLYIYLSIDRSIGRSISVYLYLSLSLSISIYLYLSLSLSISIYLNLFQSNLIYSNLF